MKNLSIFHGICRAFSLVEMLMALLVASLLMAALAPVMTRKFNENVNVSGLGKAIKAPSDMQCYPYTDTNPTVKVPLNDVYYANFIIASAGGGGAGATSSNKVAASPIQITGTSTSDTTKTIIIDEYMTDVKVTLVGAGGGGAGGAGYVAGCPSNTMEFKGNSSVKGFCMTKFNIGEEKNEVQPRTGTNYIPPFSRGVINYADNDTWGNTHCAAGKDYEGSCSYKANPSTISTTGATASVSSCGTSGYNGCARTLSQFTSAKRTCSDSFKYVPANIPEAGWSLPTNNQMTYLGETYSSSKGNLSTLGTSGLNLCSNNSATGAVTCPNTINRCYGTTGNKCHPNDIWSYDPDSPDAPYYFGFSDGTLSGPMGTSVRQAFSARCTLDKTKLMKSYSGAGGAAGAYISELDITSYVKQAGAGGTIEIKAGKEGKGGDGATSNNTKANNGTAGNLSQIIIKKQTGEIVYGIRTKGGNGGTAADSITVNGNEAINSNISTNNNCEYTLNGTNWTQTSCTKNILKGNNGNIIWATSATKGNGAISPITSNTLGNGAGGNGGTSSYGYNDKSTNENGENGKSGLVKITYNNEYPAAGGGGGGAGSVAHIKNFYLGKSSECTLTIGKGGKGGSVDNNGEDGELSSVKCSSDTRTFIVNGGKGGKKGTPALNQTTKPKEGTYGNYGEVDQYILSLDPDKREIKNGLRGNLGSENTNEANDNKSYTIGGRGGTSGTGTKGGCGGNLVDVICSINESDNERINGKGFNVKTESDSTKTVQTPSSSDIQSGAYGMAGSGGGGGGWIRNVGSGTGGEGMHGYICVYWYGEEE